MNQYNTKELLSCTYLHSFHSDKNQIILYKNVYAGLQEFICANFGTEPHRLPSDIFNDKRSNWCCILPADFYAPTKSSYAPLLG